MKNQSILTAILISLSLLSYGQTISLNPISGEYCSGTSVGVSYSVDGSFGVGNKFHLQLSDNNGGFSNPVIIGSGENVNSLQGTFPQIITEGTNYRIRVVSSNPVVVSNDNGNNLRLKQSPILTLTPSIPCQGDDVSLTVSQVSFNNLTLRKQDYLLGTNNIVPFDGISKMIRHQEIYGNEGVYNVSSTQTGCTSEQIDLFPMPCHPQVDFVVRDKNVNIFPTTNAFSSTITDMVLDENDNIYVRGYFTDSLVIGQDKITNIYDIDTPEQQSSFIAKFDKLGNKKWLRKYTDRDNSNQGTKLAYENGNLYITGFFQNTANTDDINDPNNRIARYGTFKIQNEQGGSIFSKISYCNYPQINKTYYQGDYLWLAKFDSSGNFVFHKQLTKNRGICPQNPQDFIGFSQNVISTNIKVRNDKLWISMNTSISGTPFELDNGFISNNFSDLVFVKLNKDDGNIQKTEVISSQNITSNYYKIVNFEIDSQSNLIICSTNGHPNSYASSMTFGTTNINFTQHELFVAKYNETNGWVWIRQSNNYTYFVQENHQLSIDSQDNIVLQVKLRSNIIFSLAGINSQSVNYDCSDNTLGILKLSSAGLGLWLNTVQGIETSSSGTDNGKRIAFDSNNNIYILSYAQNVSCGGSGGFNIKHIINNDRYFDWAGSIYQTNGLYFTVFKHSGELLGAFSNMKFPKTNGGSYFMDLSFRINSQNKLIISGGFVRDILIGNQLYSNKFPNINGTDYTQQFFITSLTNPQSIILKEITTASPQICGNEQIQVSFEPFGTFPSNTKFKAQLVKGNGNVFYSYGESATSPITISVPDSILTYNTTENKFYVRILSTDDKVIGTHNITKYVQAKKKPTVNVLSNTNQNSVCLSNVAYQSLYGQVQSDGINSNSYQWKLNGQNVGTDNFQYFPQTIAETGEYTLSVTNNGCATTSTPYFFSIVEPASATISGSSSIYQGQSSSLPISLTGGFPYTVNLSDGQQKTLNTNTGSFLVSPTANTTYTISSVSNACGNGSVTGSALVTILQCTTGLTLVSPNDDISSGVFDKRASVSNGTITASNKILGVGTRGSYTSKVILLTPGFKVDNGTVFTGSIGGCD